MSQGQPQGPRVDEVPAHALGRARRLPDRHIADEVGVRERSSTPRYRGLVLARPVFVGDTLRTRTEVVGLKQNRRREGAPTTGLVALRITTVDQLSRPVLDFWRCPMLPLREPDAVTGHADDFEDIPQVLASSAVERAVPAGWDLEPLRDAAPGPHHAELVPGSAFAVEGGETVTGAPELARLTLNVAMAHTDATSTAHGRRLVYGGHTISVAAAHATRAIPAIATILAWGGCDHLGPVFEGDVLRTELRVEGASPLGLGRRHDAAARSRVSGAEAPASGRSCSTGGSLPSWPRKEAE